MCYFVPEALFIYCVYVQKLSSTFNAADYYVQIYMYEQTALYVTHCL